MEIFRKVVALILALLAIGRSQAASFLDPTDECILLCDRCFHDDALLDCANDCLLSGGDVRQKFKARCPFFRNAKPGLNQII